MKCLDFRKSYICYKWKRIIIIIVINIIIIIIVISIIIHWIMSMANITRKIKFIIIIKSINQSIAKAKFNYTNLTSWNVFFLK